MNARAMRFAAVALFASLPIGYALTARARATVELCPATASVPMPSGAAFGTPSRTFYYDLTAPTKRSFDVTLIADTTAGWFGWNAGSVTLTDQRRQYRSQWVPSGFQILPYLIAASPTLTVTFPEMVAIRHMWVVSAAAAQCDVPGFDGPSDMQAPPTGEVAPPAQRDAAATASAVAPPFAGSGCDQPFVPATVAKALAPDLSFGLYEGTIGRIATAVLVAVDSGGHVLDAWTLASSGNARFDLAAVRAARRSTYAGAISYCRPIRSTYVFISTAVPGG